MKPLQSCKEKKILHYKGKFQNSIYVKASKPPKQTKIETESENKMKLFTGQVEVRETDTVNVEEDWLEVFDKNGNMTYFENDELWWEKREFDENGNVTYYENSDKQWERRAFDENGKETYYEDSNGEFFDKRLKEITIEELTKMGYKLKENKK